MVSCTTCHFSVSFLIFCVFCCSLINYFSVFNRKCIVSHYRNLYLSNLKDDVFHIIDISNVFLGSGLLYVGSSLNKLNIFVYVWLRFSSSLYNVRLLSASTRLHCVTIFFWFLFTSSSNILLYPYLSRCRCPILLRFECKWVMTSCISIFNL